MQIQKSFQLTGGKLYLVPTPIGNLDDMTPRAKQILVTADYIAAEDTRTTGKLLELLGIKSGAKLLSFHEHNARQKAAEIVDLIQAGMTVAQVSDAGMPVISDPGSELVEAALAADLDVVSLPGASAFLTALVGSGLEAQPFTYYGFIPRKKSQQVDFLTKIQNNAETAIFYESPHRITKTLANLAEVVEPERQIVIARELTKLHEEYLRGTVAELVAYFADHEVKGEMVVLLAGASATEIELDFAALIGEVDDLVAAGTSKKDAIMQVAKDHQIKKNELYEQYHQQ